MALRRFLIAILFGSFMTDNRSLSERAADDPDLMRVWGEVNNAWDEIERLLYRTFEVLLPGVDGFATTSIFYSQKAHAARRDMVEELAKTQLALRPKLQKRIASAIRRVKARSNDRNTLAHGMWSISADLATGKQGLARMGLQPSPTGPFESYDLARLKRVRDEMQDTARALKDAIEPLDAEWRKELAENHMKRFEAKAALAEKPE